MTTTHTGIVLRGSLNFLGLGELLQLLGSSGSTGVIKLISRFAEEPGKIYCLDGNPVDAEYQNAKGINALNGFFGWLDAQFEFSQEPVTIKKSIQKSRMEIILDGLRMLDDGLIPILGGADARKPHQELKDASGLPVVKGPLVDYLYIVDEDEFEDGQEIVVQERYGNWLWVILDGVVEVVRLMPEGQAPICKLGDGAFIGSINSLKEKSNVRSATVTAMGKVQLGVLDYHRILEEYAKLSEAMKDVLTAIDRRLRKVTNTCAGAVFGKVKLKKNLSHLKSMKLQSEDDSDMAMSIGEGKALIARKVEGGYLPLCVLGPGEIIGNIGFLNTPHEPHSAEVFVSDDFEARPLPLANLKKEYDQLSTTLKNIIQHTTISLSITTGRLVDLLKQHANEAE